MIHPSFEIAVEDDIIRKNPAKKALGDYGEPEKKRTALTLDHQLTYKNYGDGCNFHKTLTKTQAGIRVIPMRKIVGKDFETQRRLNLQRGIPRGVEIDGLSDFIFMSRSGRPMMLSSVNFILRDIVKIYNEEEKERAKRERRKPEEMPHISAHILRNTACTRMARSFRGNGVKMV